MMYLSHFFCRRFTTACLSTLLFLSVPALHADQWIQPTPEELSMTSQPEVPGATAVYLYREETTDDHLHNFSIYVRLKVLTEGGKEYGNVELPYIGGIDGYSVDDITGRTIHADCTIIPFTGKPYDKLIEKSQEVKYKAKVFSLPDVQVGSIIEYRYKMRTNDHWLRSPDWYIQSELFTRKAHYLWRPTSKQLITNDDRGQLTSSIAWMPVLPKGVDLKQTQLPGNSLDSGQLIMELNIDNVPPAPSEDFMPPIKSLTYRVLFYYTPYRSADEFWKSEGKYWAKRQNKFIGPGSAVTAAVTGMVAPGDTDDQKLHKIYDAVMKMENTDYTREHSATEDKSEGLKAIHNTDDVWNRKRGSGDQLADLFVAMARAAGMKAYIMAVTNRDRNLFIQGYLTLGQLDDDIAIVNVGGKDLYFDPGTRYCEFGHLAWKHDEATGLRQTDGGAEIVMSPGDNYPANHTSRVADLVLDEHGVASGPVILTVIGSPALRWRQRGLVGDSTSLERELRVNMEQMLPAGMDVKVEKIEGLEDYDKPLKITYSVKGPVGSATGKRLLLPGDIFVSNEKPSFPHEKRDIAVYFDYPYYTQDATRFKFPAEFTIESAPSAIQLPYQKTAFYKLTSQYDKAAVIVRRDFAMGDVLFKTEDYKNLRTFFGQFETKDQENIILKLASTQATATGGN